MYRHSQQRCPKGTGSSPPAPLGFAVEITKCVHRYKITHARTKGHCYVLYTTCITHLAKSTRLHYTMDVVLLLQLCMVAQSPVQGMECWRTPSLPHLLSRHLYCILKSYSLQVGDSKKLSLYLLCFLDALPCVLNSI